MSEARVRIGWLAAVCLAMLAGCVALAAPSEAAAEETVWICKPGQVDDLCAGSISTKAYGPADDAADDDAGTPLDFTRPRKAPVDCFYIYPTVVPPTGGERNANLDKAPEVRRVVVQQARMFSRVCDVYAPMYRQETVPGVYTEFTEIAYQSALAGWKDYLRNYNKGRGVILLGHSQGSATLGRLIDEEIDPRPQVRKRLVGAILPGANIFVPKGELIGGMYENVPVCSKVGEYGCLVAYSTFNGSPPDNPRFSDLGSGYWAYKIPRPDREQYEAVCANPATLSGEDYLTPLINMDYLLNPPPGDVEVAFWRAFPNAGSASCDREGTKHWLNVDFTDQANPFLHLMVPVVADGNDWHVPEVNIAENNLVKIAQRQSDNYTAEQKRIRKLKAKLKNLNGKLRKARKLVTLNTRKAKRLARQARSARGKRKQALNRKTRAVRRKAASQRKRVNSLKRQVARTKQQLA